MASSAALSSSTVSDTLRRLGHAYEDARRRVIGLVDEGDVSLTVPACPGWAVHDVLAHLAGLCTDISTGNIEGSPSEEWTGAQVATRGQWHIDEILAEWDDVGPQIAAVVDDFPGSYGRQVVADIAVHEQDIRGALGLPGARDSEAFDIGLDFLVDVTLDDALKTHELGTLEVRAGSRSWVVGGGDPRAVVDAAPFELFRAVSGRRSRAQIGAFDWSADPKPYLVAFGFQPFKIRTDDLIE